jgi:hypothetical protein
LYVFLLSHPPHVQVYFYQVYRRHLLSQGVAASDVIDSPLPICTTTELIALVGLALKHEWKHVLVIGDEYQMPRVRLLWALIQAYPLTSEDVDATPSQSRDATFLQAKEHSLRVSEARAEEEGKNEKLEEQDVGERGRNLRGETRAKEKRESFGEQEIGVSDNEVSDSGKEQLSMFARSVRFFSNRLLYRRDQLLTPDFLQQLRAFRSSKVPINVTFLSSRAILEREDASRMAEFAHIYRSPNLMKRLQLEKRGVELLMNGTYYLPAGTF